MKQRVDVAALIDAAPFAGLPLAIACLAFLIQIGDGYDIQSMAFAAPVLAGEWHLPREGLGPLLVASTIGMALGALLLGWIADRIGRKKAYCGCIALLAIGSFGSAAAWSILSLFIWRLVTGLGIGAAAGIAAAYVAEWTPRQWRSFAVAIAVVAVPVGGMVGAAIARALIPAYGWRAVFLVGGLSPLLLLVAALVLLPESPKYLAGQRDGHARLARSLNRLLGAARFDGTEEFWVSEPEPVRRGAFSSLLRSPLLATTLLLWAAFSCNTLALYGFVNWLPTVLSAAGAPLSAALTGSFGFNLGGIVGSLLGSALIGLYGSRAVGTTVALLGAFAAIALGIETAGSAASGISAASALFVWVALAGLALNGMQAYLYAVAAHSYPTSLRGTGVGSASALARVGGVLSSVLGSAFFSMGLPVAAFFFLLSAVIVLTAVSFYALRSHIPGGSPARRSRSAPSGVVE